MENELLNLQKKIMDLESKLNYGDQGNELEPMHQTSVHGGSGESEDMPRPLQSAMRSDKSSIHPENIMKSTARAEI